ncbi:hypothetical protein JTB14_030081 [Gonioctena quinquepunctata]|nr:hypothetical protein JTB14_030081 [Gonioctena quinquepunctata]
MERWDGPRLMMVPRLIQNGVLHRTKGNESWKAFLWVTMSVSPLEKLGWERMLINEVSGADHSTELAWCLHKMKIIEYDVDVPIRRRMTMGLS